VIGEGQACEGREKDVTGCHSQKLVPGKFASGNWFFVFGGASKGGLFHEDRIWLFLRMIQIKSNQIKSKLVLNKLSKPTCSLGPYVCLW
jgi:hypothetical protein